WLKMGFLSRRFALFSGHSFRAPQCRQGHVGVHLLDLWPCAARPLHLKDARGELWGDLGDAANLPASLASPLYPRLRALDEPQPPLAGLPREDREQQVSVARPRAFGRVHPCFAYGDDAHAVAVEIANVLTNVVLEPADPVQRPNHEDAEFTTPGV